MNLFVALYAGVLFYLLTPNILLRLPQKGSKQMVAFVHAIVFALVLFLTTKFVWMLSSSVVAMLTPKPQTQEGLPGNKCDTNTDCNTGAGETCQDNICSVSP